MSTDSTRPEHDGKAGRRPRSWSGDCAPDLEQHLVAHGCERIRHGTRHDVGRSPAAARPVTVPRHSEVPYGTTHAICRQLGSRHLLAKVANGSSYGVYRNLCLTTPVDLRGRLQIPALGPARTSRTTEVPFLHSYNRGIQAGCRALSQATPSVDAERFVSPLEYPRASCDVSRRPRLLMPTSGARAKDCILIFSTLGLDRGSTSAEWKQQQWGGGPRESRR